jgi:hypothetical protein
VDPGLDLAGVDVQDLKMSTFGGPIFHLLRGDRPALILGQACQLAGGQRAEAVHVLRMAGAGQAPKRKQLHSFVVQ